MDKPAVTRQRRTPQRWARRGIGGERSHVVDETRIDTGLCGEPLMGAPVLAKLLVDTRCQRAACRRGWPAELRLVS